MLHRYVVQVVAPIPSSDCHVRGGASCTCSESEAMRAGGFSGSSRETGRREKEESRESERMGRERS